jgi:outer membrane protease
MYIEVEGTLQSRFEIGKLIKNSAFPFEIEHKDGKVYAKGLTKREYFAAMAMQGYITNAGYSIDEDARLAVQAADALIKALNEPQP